MKRIQRKRTRGWRMPANAKYIGRPSKWGNPYRPYDYLNLESCLLDYRRWLDEQLMEDPNFLDALRDKDLACWCPLSSPCHADVLLEYLRALYKD